MLSRFPDFLLDIHSQGRGLRSNSHHSQDPSYSTTSNLHLPLLISHPPAPSKCSRLLNPHWDVGAGWDLGLRGVRTG